jgi:hypothetical protein
MATKFSEWASRVNDVLVPHIYRGLKNLYDTVRRKTERSNKKIVGVKGTTLLSFQYSLEAIVDLPQTTLNEDYDVLITGIQRKEQIDDPQEWFETLIGNAFDNYAIEILQVDPDHLETPTASVFIHKCYINCARHFWKHPYLFYHGFDPIKQQSNIKEIMDEIRNAVGQTFREGAKINKNLIKDKFKGMMHHTVLTDSEDDEGDIMSDEESDIESFESLSESTQKGGGSQQPEEASATQEPNKEKEPLDKEEASTTQEPNKEKDPLDKQKEPLNKEKHPLDKEEASTTQETNKEKEPLDKEKEPLNKEKQPLDKEKASTTQEKPPDMNTNTEEPFSTPPSGEPEGGELSLDGEGEGDKTPAPPIKIKVKVKVPLKDWKSVNLGKTEEPEKEGEADKADHENKEDYGEADKADHENKEDYGEEYESDEEANQRDEELNREIDYLLADLLLRA